MKVQDRDQQRPIFRFSLLRFLLLLTLLVICTPDWEASANQSSVMGLSSPAGTDNPPAIAVANPAPSAAGNVPALTAAQSADNPPASAQGGAPSATPDEDGDGGATNQFIPIYSAATSSSGGYKAVLSSPAPPVVSSSFVWRVSGSKPTAEEQIAFVLLTGCWIGQSIVHAGAKTAIGTTLPTSIDQSEIRISGVRDRLLPLTITVQFRYAQAAASNSSKLTVKTDSNGDWDDGNDGDGDALFPITTGGPACAASTSTPTPRPTARPSATATASPRHSATPTSSNTPTNSPTNTATSSPTFTNTPTFSPTGTGTNSPTATNSATNTATNTATTTPTDSATATASPTGTDTATATATATSTATPSITPTPTNTRTPSYELPGGLIVSAAYADGEPTLANFPQPWAGAPNVIFDGNCTSGVNCDTAALRIDNPTTVTATVKDISIAFPNPTYGLTVVDPWYAPPGGVPSPYPITIPPGDSVILASLGAGEAADNFDTSDGVPALPNGSCTTSLPPYYYPPIISVTMGDGSIAKLYDTGHVLDTGGSGGDCVTQWHPIGTAGLTAPDMNVSLSPASVNQQLQQPQVFTARVTDSTGVVPLEGVTVNFHVLSGPDAGQSGQGVTDSLGLASYTDLYTGTTAATDQLVATALQGSATFASNTAMVHWVIQLFGTLEISPPSIGLLQSSTQSFTITALDTSNATLPAVQVSLQVSGHNSQLLTASTGANGVATFTYANSGGAGTDTVQASATIGGGLVNSDAVQVPWDALLEVNTDGTHGKVLRYDGSTGTPIDTLIATGAAGLGSPLAVTIGPDGNLYVSDTGGSGDLVLRYNGVTLAPMAAPGAFGATFVAARSDVQSYIARLTFGPDGNLYLMENGFGANSAILRFNGSTGAALPAPGQSGAVFVPLGSLNFSVPTGMAFGRDHNLYVTVGAAILRFSGATGAPLPGAGGSSAVLVTCPQGVGDLTIGPDGNLYVTIGDGHNEVLRFDPTGAPLPAPGQSGSVFVVGGSGGLNAVGALLFGSDGNLYVSDFTNKVYRYNGTTGAPLPASGQSGALFVSTSIPFQFNVSSLAFGGPDQMPTFVPTSTPSPTVTNTPTLSATPTASRTATTTPTSTNTFTPGPTVTGTQSPSSTPTNSPTPGASPTSTGTATGTATTTGTPTVSPTPTATFDPNERITGAIDTPSGASQLTGTVPITGSAAVSSGTLAGYTLAYAPLGSSTFTVAATGTTAVSNGLLGTLDTTVMRDGQYTLQLQVQAADGQTAIFDGPIVTVVGELKIGNLQLSVQDLSVPVQGIPVSVSRSFDNYLHRQGDFGMNWTETTSSASAFEDTCLANITVQLPISDQPITFTFNPTDTGYNIDGFEIFAPAWNPDPATGAQLSDVNGASAGPAFGVDTENPECWFDLYNNFAPYAPAQLAVTTTDGTVYKITANIQNGLTEVDEPNLGAKLSYTLNGVTSSRGPAVHFTRDSQGRITSVTDPAGKSILYAYDGNGDLSTVTDRDGGVTTYHYDGSHDLLSVTDPTGKTAAVAQYSAAGQLTGITNALGHTTSFAVDLTARQQTITDGRGNSTVNLFDANGDIVQSTDPLGNVTKYSYDPTTHRPLTVTDPLGRTTKLAYDASGNLTQQTDPLGNVKGFSYDAGNHLLRETLNGTVQVQYGYDSSGNPASMTDPLGNVTQFSTGNDAVFSVTYPSGTGASQGGYLEGPGGTMSTYSGPNDTGGTAFTRDALGRVTSSSSTVSLYPTRTETTSYSYDAEGHVLTSVDPMGGVTTNSYDTAGRLTSTTDPLSNTTTYSYDALGQLVTTTYADGSTETATYDANGNVLTTTDQNGDTTSYVYDADNRLIETDFPDGSRATSSYNAGGEQIAGTDGAGGTTTYAYDAAGRLLSQTDPLGHSVNYSYDPVTGDLASITDPAGHVTSYSYDGDHRRTAVLTSVTLNGISTPISTTTTYTGLNLPASITDPLGRVTSYGYNGSGDITRATDPLNFSANYTYDGHGNVVSLTDALGNQTQQAYDLNDRLGSVSEPGGATTSYVYDAAGNLATTIDARGQVTTYSYDQLNRVVAISYPDHTVTFTYYPGGQRKTITDTRGAVTATTSYAIDSMGRVTTITEPNGQHLQYSYDGAGRRTRITTPAGTTGYSYDLAGRLLTVTDPHGAVTAYSYDSRGNLTSTTLPNGITTAYTYDELSRLIALTTSKGATQLWQDLYTLDAAGRRVSVQETDQSRTLTTYSYSYDSDGRLTHEQQQQGPTTLVSTSYSYDAAGDRLKRVDSSGTTTSIYNSRGQLLSQAAPGGTTTYAYDADGNQTTRVAGGVSTSYAYDSQNQLLGVATGGITTTTYSYDPDGNLTGEIQAGVTTTNLVDPVGMDGLSQLLESTQSGAAGGTTDYVYGNARVSMDQGAGNLSYYLYDGNMNTRLLTGGTGTVQNSYRYDAFGNLLASTGAVSNPFLYGGQQFDAGVGLYYLRARFMDPAQGQFLSEDPGSPSLTDPVTLHRYLYAGDNPVSNMDPSGADFSLVDVLASTSIASALNSQPVTNFLKNPGNVSLNTAKAIVLQLNTLAGEYVKLRDRGTLSVAADVTALFGSNDPTAQTALKLACNTLSLKKLPASVQKLQKSYCALKKNLGLLLGMVGFDGKSGSLPGSAVNLAAALEVIFWQDQALTWTNALPRSGLYINRGFNSAVDQAFAAEFGLNVFRGAANIAGSLTGASAAFANASINELSTFEAMQLAEEEYTSLVVNTVTSWYTGVVGDS